MDGKGFFRHAGVWIAIAMSALWALAVTASGWGWNPSGLPWNFHNTAELADSFGLVSAGMAGVAAYYAYRTYQSAREDSAKLERRSAEPSFLNLLERRFDLLDRVRTSWLRIAGPDTGSVDTFGQVALDNIAARLRAKADSLTGDAFRQIDATIYNMPNLYRFTYHIVAFADRQFSETPPDQPMVKSDLAYQYLRLLRAQISNAELLLIALNCVHGEGRAKFKPLVERYALLHNMLPDDIAAFRLTTLFADTAFGLTPEDRTAIGDGVTASA